jgi:hypothetical protein
VYAPSATPNGEHDLTVIFAGYHTPKPKNGLGDYRTISRITLHSDQAILATSTNLNPRSGDEEGDN